LRLTPAPCQWFTEEEIQATVERLLGLAA